MAKFKPKDGSIKFKEATQNMNTKEKMAYFWEYYKWLVFVSIAAISIIIYTLNTHNPATHLHIVVTTGFSHTSDRFQFDDIEDGDEEEFDMVPMLPNPYGFTVDTEELSNTLDHMLLDDELFEDNTVIVQNMPLDIQTIPVFSTLAGAGELDIVITYLHDYEAMAPLGHFRSITDLDVDLPDHIFINDDGILLRYLPIFNDYIHPNNTDTELVLAISGASRRIEEVEDLLSQLFE